MFNRERMSNIVQSQGQCDLTFATYPNQYKYDKPDEVPQFWKVKNNQCALTSEQ